jgi:hypothetical protein
MGTALFVACFFQKKTVFNNVPLLGSYYGCLHNFSCSFFSDEVGLKEGENVRNQDLFYLIL